LKCLKSFGISKGVFQPEFSILKNYEQEISAFSLNNSADMSLLRQKKNPTLKFKFFQDRVFFRLCCKFLSSILAKKAGEIQVILTPVSFENR